MITEHITATGKLEVTVYDSNNHIKQQLVIPNLVVTVGKNFIADRMIGTSSAVMSHMAVGTSNVNLVAANMTLDSELTRVALTSATRTNNVIRYIATYLPGDATGSLTEAGIFNDDTAGTMLCRTVFAVVSKEAADTLTINWDVTIN